MNFNLGKCQPQLIYFKYYKILDISPRICHFTKVDIRHLGFNVKIRKIPKLQKNIQTIAVDFNYLPYLYDSED